MVSHGGVFARDRLGGEKRLFVVDESGCWSGPACDARSQRNRESAGETSRSSRESSGREEKRRGHGGRSRGCIKKKKKKKSVAVKGREKKKKEKRRGRGAVGGSII